MANSDDECPNRFAQQLEQLSVIRSRLRRNMHWLQWPVRVCQSKHVEDEGEVETHNICITQLTLEAPFS